jgi:hypothetical protein
LTPAFGRGFALCTDAAHIPAALPISIIDGSIRPAWMAAAKISGTNGARSRFMNQFDSLSRRAIQAPESGIVAVVNHGRLKPG